MTGDTDSRVASIPEALAAGEVVILAMPGKAVAELTAEHGALLHNRLVIDATNRMGQPVVNARSALPPDVRYARAFNTLGGENLENPVFPDGVADMFFSAPDADRSTVEEVIRGVGLRPVFVGPDQEEIVDSFVPPVGDPGDGPGTGTAARFPAAGGLSRRRQSTWVTDPGQIAPATAPTSSSATRRESAADSAR